MRNKLFFFILSGLAMSGLGCKKNPIDRLVNPVPSGAVNQTSGIFIVYDDDLKTGGGLGFLPGGENQAIDLADNTTPTRTLNDIRYSWNGQDVTNNGTPQHLFAGFALLITPDFTTFNSAQSKNLTGPGYHTLKFFIRGTLSDRTAVRIEGPDDGLGGITPVQSNSRRQGDAVGGDFVLTNDWQEVSLTVTPSHFTAVKSFITVSFQFSQPAGTSLPGGGGVIFLDDVRYVQ